MERWETWETRSPSCPGCRCCSDRILKRKKRQLPAWFQGRMTTKLAKIERVKSVYYSWRTTQIITIYRVVPDPAESTEANKRKFLGKAADGDQTSGFFPPDLRKPLDIPANTEIPHQSGLGAQHHFSLPCKPPQKHFRCFPSSFDLPHYVSHVCAARRPGTMHIKWLCSSQSHD